MVQTLDLAVNVVLLMLMAAMTVAAIIRMVQRGHIEHTGYGERQAFRDLLRWLHQAGGPR